MVIPGGIRVKQRVFIFCSYCCENKRPRNCAYMLKKSLKRHNERYHAGQPLSWMLSWATPQRNSPTNFRTEQNLENEISNEENSRNQNFEEANSQNENYNEENVESEI